VTQADQNLAQKLYKNLESHKRFVVDKKDRVRTPDSWWLTSCVVFEWLWFSVRCFQPMFQFSVRHYAGLVTYSSAGFVEKNKDQIHDEASDLVKLSSNDALQQSYEFVEQAQKARAAAASSSVRPLVCTTLLLFCGVFAVVFPYVLERVVGSLAHTG
jgi:hypothetical protein